MDIADTRLFGGKYQVVELLKSDRSGDHFLANDLLGGIPVIIRLVKLSSISAAARLRLEREAKELGELRSPWLAGILEIGQDDDLLYVVRPFVHGISLRDRLAKSRLSSQEAITLGRCLFSALKLAHERRVFHHCIRPTNIIVDEQIPLSAAVLNDFSLGMQSHTSELPAEESVDTALYLSPENAGALDHDIGETSDLYSAGIVLFECLAGHPPFHGEKVGTILYQHMTASVPELRSMGVDLPRALDELIQRLLRKDPRDRYQTAQAVSMDLDSIVRCGEGNLTFVVGSHDRRPTLTEPALVGRETELNLIEEQIRQVFAGKSRLIYLESESGGGKTRLEGEIALRGVKAGMWVLRGQGMEQAGQKPFQILSGIVEQVTEEARSNPNYAEALRDRMDGQIDALATVLPELARVLNWKVAEEASPQIFTENRSIQALAALLKALGTPEQPVLVILDDCQWADDLTCKLLRWRQTQANAGPSHVLLIAAFRSEDVAKTHLLRGIEPSVQIRLPAFTGDEIRQLLESMAGKLPEVAVKLISQFAEGNPFMASAVLRGMVESGALITDADGWQVEPQAMADLNSSSRAANFLARRLTLLPAETIQLLSTAAIFGKQFDPEIVATLSGQSREQSAAALEEARQRHLVWSCVDGSTCAFVHDRIRSALLDRLTFGQFAELHRKAAMYLEQNAPDRIADIAYHFDAAGDSRSALPYALQAAERARAEHALDVAEQHYRIAERCDGISDASVRYRIAEGLGDVLMLQGKYALAGELFESAAAFAEGSFAKAQICGKIGELALKRGDMLGAARAIEKGLQFLHRKIPQKPFSCMAGLLWHFSAYLLHSMVPAWLSRRGKKIADKEVLLQLRLLSRLGYVYWFSRRRIIDFLVHFIGMNLAERYAPSSEMGQFYSDHAVAMTLLGRYGRGIRFAQKSFEIRRSLGDVWGQGQSLSFYGVVLYAASRYRECIEKCREAVELLERMGDFWEVHIARYQIAASLYRLGDLQAAVEEARQVHNSGVELGDEQAAGINLDVWSRASGGKIPSDILRNAVGKKRVDVQAAAQVSLAQGVQLTESGRHEEAVSVLEKALFDNDQFLGLLNAYVAPLLPWLATALRRQAESPQNRTSTKRDALLGRAEAVARRAVRHARRFRNELPHALREYALIMAMSGKTGSVHRLLEKSLAIALKQDAKYEYAQTLLAYGQLGLELDWENAASRIAEAQSLLEKMVVAGEGEEDTAAHSKSASLSLYDRFDTVLVSGRKIASALSGAAIFEESRRAALRLLRAEHCLVLQILGEGDNFRLIPVAGGSDGKFDEALVRKALKAHKAIAVCGESASRAAENSGSEGKQSTLCVPLNVRGRAVACLYVDHRHIQNLFGPNEVRLADFIATIAGAALENAEGFKQLQQLNATLEQRVVERTAAAESRSRELAQSNQELERVASELLQTQEQLRIAMQAAHAANHAKSRFLATMSHEIRTPMNGIIGMTELALGTSLTGQQRNYLNTLKDSAYLLLEIINDILDFSKIEAGKMELESIPCDIRKIMHDVARLLAVSAAKKDLELVCRIAADVPAEVLGDPKRLRQIIVNLLGNAIKFTERGEVLLRVDLAERTGDKVQLRFTVRDTGIGIPADKVGHIFEAFRQSDSSMTRRFGGTGLGLAISAQIVELMGGRIVVESELGEGSAFSFTASFQLPAGTETSAEKRPVFPQGCALVVSGNQNVREYCGEILENAGLHVRLIENHETAREAILAANADAHENQISSLLVIDAGQNRAEGFDFLETLNHGEITRWQVVVLTPAGLVDGVERCQKLGIEHCIAKPVKADELLETVQAALDSCSVEDVVDPVLSEQQKGRVLCVLVADDSPVNQEVASGLLELRGHVVQVVDNGRDAVEAFRGQSFDVILMDVEMPEMDGLTAATMIRSLEKEGNRRVPILAMTAHLLNSAQQQCLDAGMDGYISKPIQPKELYQALEKYCPAPVLIK